MSMKRTIRAPRGPQITCKGWVQEAAMRMLMNNLDPDVAERPEELVVYGGMGKAARNWAAYDAIVRELQQLADDETLLIQSGKPVGVFRTHERAPRVLISNSVLVPRWSTWEHFHELEQKGLMMYGQMTAGSWIYIGTQGILQGTYETFAEAARQHAGGSLKGTLTLTAGLGGMGGAQPLAVTLNEGVVIAVEVDRSRILRRIETRYCDAMAKSIDEAWLMANQALKEGRPLSIGLLGNAAEVMPEFVRRGWQPDFVTDQTAAHDPLNGYVPAGLSLGEAAALRAEDPDRYLRLSKESMAVHVQAMLDLQTMGSVVFDYGNNIRQVAYDQGVTRAFDFPGFVPAYIRPLFCEGKGPFRWAALSGDPEDIRKTDELVLRLFPDNERLHRWITMASKRVAFQGLPARICWLGYGERAAFGLAINDMVKRGELKAPMVIGRDHLDCGSVASPNRETEGMRDGSDAVADWAILNALINTSAGASWVSVHHGGGVGIGYSLHAGMVVVADGSDAAAERLQNAIPLEYRGRAEEFVDLVIQEIIPQVAEEGLAEFCDVFCEEGVFSVEQSRRILVEGKRCGLTPKIHADEIVSLGGSELAGEVGAISAEHLVAASDEGLRRLAEGGVVPVLLPGTSFYLGLSRHARAREMIDRFNLPVALSTDYNPGSCPTESIQLIMMLASLNLKMTPEEILTACTINAAHAIGLSRDIGTLEPGKRADLVIFDAPNIAYLPYHFGINHTFGVIKNGNIVVWNRRITNHSHHL